MAKNSQKNIDVRRNTILKMVEKGEETVTTLAEKLQVSNMTVRRDVEDMISMQMLQWGGGGVIKLPESLFVDPGYAKRQLSNRRKKIAIAREAIKLVNAGMMIGIDASTTTLELATLLLGINNISVVTNSLLVPQALAGHPSATIEVAGGCLRSAAFSTVGARTCKLISRYSYDVAFLSVNAVDPTYGLTDTSAEEIDTKVSFLENAKQRVLLADSGKFGVRSLCRCCGIDGIDMVITDEEISQQQYDLLVAQKVNVVVAKI